VLKKLKTKTTIGKKLTLIFQAICLQPGVQNVEML